MKRIFWITLLLLFSFTKVSAAVYVVHDMEERVARSFVFELDRRLLLDVPLVPVRSHAFLKNSAQKLKENDLIVTVGAKSAQQVCSSLSKGVVVAVFIGKEEFQKAQSDCSVPSSAVFSGAPLDTRFALLKAIWFDRKPLAVLHSNHLLIDQESMSRQAKEYGFELNFHQTELDRLSVLKSVNFVLEESAMIFSLVDSELYQNTLAQDILKLLFYKRQVMVGPFLPFVKAGALLAIDSDTEVKLQVLTNHITVWHSSRVLLPAQYPDKLRVSFNPHLIKAYGIVPPSAAFLRDEYGLCSDTQCD